jgi:hypothetical protein
MGQVMTPPWIVSYINDSVIGKVEEMEEGDEERLGSCERAILQLATNDHYWRLTCSSTSGGSTTDIAVTRRWTISARRPMSSSSIDEC